MKGPVDQKGLRHEKPVALRMFDWFVRPWHYFNTIPRAVAYLIAASGFYGGALFVIGSFAGCSPAVRLTMHMLLFGASPPRDSRSLSVVPQVYASYSPGDGLKTQYDWLVLFIFMVGTYVFTMGCSLLYVDANNAHYPQQMAAYNAGGRKGKRPR